MSWCETSQILTATVLPDKKRLLRPALLLLTAQACGRVAPAHHLLGAVIEMIHTATLVHDDVLDAAATRRHVPTINAGWGTMVKEQGDFLASHTILEMLQLLNSDSRAARERREAPR